MISKKWYVTVVGLAALLAGCFSSEKKRSIKKENVKINHNDYSKKSHQHEESGLGYNTNSLIAQEQMYSETDNSSKTTRDPFNNNTASFNGVGTSTFKLPLHKAGISSTSFDLLVPLRNSESSLTFSQLGMRRHNDRNIVNFGLGQRHFIDNWMLGYNAFFDAQISGNRHQRAGLGLELWGDYLKFSANSYHRLSGWKSSSQLSGNNERAVNGFDIMAQAFLPSYSQLGAKVKYEQYFGDDVATLSRNERHKNPAALTLGLSYTPVPLITLGADHSRWNNGRSETKGNVTFNYRFNVPLAQQLDTNYTPLQRSLAGSRLDVVSRNNNIVLEYQKKETFSFQLPSELKGFEGERKIIDFSISAKYDVDHINWDDHSLRANGGKIITINAKTYQVRLPNFDSQGTNNYIISAVAYDKKGNASNRSEMSIISEKYLSRETPPQPYSKSEKIVANKEYAESVVEDDHDGSDISSVIRDYPDGSSFYDDISDDDKFELETVDLDSISNNEEETTSSIGNPSISTPLKDDSSGTSSPPPPYLSFPEQSKSSNIQDDRIFNLSELMESQNNTNQMSAFDDDHYKRDEIINESVNIPLNPQIMADANQKESPKEFNDGTDPKLIPGTAQEEKNSEIPITDPEVVESKREDPSTDEDAVDGLKVSKDVPALAVAPPPPPPPPPPQIPTNPISGTSSDLKRNTLPPNFKPGQSATPNDGPSITAEELKRRKDNLRHSETNVYIPKRELKGVMVGISKAIDNQTADDVKPENNDDTVKKEEWDVEEPGTSNGISASPGNNIENSGNEVSKGENGITINTSLPKSIGLDKDISENIQLRRKSANLDADDDSQTDDNENSSDVFNAN